MKREERTQRRSSGSELVFPDLDLLRVLCGEPTPREGRVLSFGPPGRSVIPETLEMKPTERW
jgi:hypothetical protein